MNNQKYTFFWKTESVFSNWHPSIFKDESDISFPNMETYMMYYKAICFSDAETADKILKNKHPKEAKALGRQVKNFNNTEWDKVKEDIVYRGCYLKFTQNSNLKKALLATVNTILAEASPFDKVYGIGLNEEDAKKISPDKWPGQNLLGKILTQLRDDILEKEKSGNLYNSI